MSRTMVGFFCGVVLMSGCGTNVVGAFTTPAEPDETAPLPEDSGPTVDSDLTDSDSDSDSDSGSGSGDTGLRGTIESFATWGLYPFTVPEEVTSLTVRTNGAGGGGVSALPWSNANGGRAASVEATLEVSPGTELVVVVGRGGSATSCGGGTPGAGGGGLSGVLTIAFEPLVVAAGGGGASVSGNGCNAELTSCGSSGPAMAGGDGFGGGGQRSDNSAQHGSPGLGAPDFTGGSVAPEGNCGNLSGSGGFGGGGGGGGTYNGFGGGGGGGGFPGGNGGQAGGAGGTSHLAPVAVLVTSGPGSTGGAPGVAGTDGFVEIEYLPAR